MAAKTRAWVSTDKYERGARVEEYQHSDGTMHYSFRDRLGRASNVRNWDEAQKLIKTFWMKQI